MEEMVARVAAAAGIEPDVARKASAAILAFLLKEGPPAEVEQLFAKLPGAAELAASSETEAASGGGMLGGLMGLVGGGGGLMGLAGKLTALGLGMDQMQAVGRELFAVGREQVGEDTMGQIAGSIPGLGQFV